MPDLEKGIKEEGMDPHHAPQVPAVAEDEEHERVIPRYRQVFFRKKKISPGIIISTFLLVHAFTRPHSSLCPTFA
jgi:hypothetical protein